MGQYIRGAYPSKSALPSLVDFVLSGCFSRPQQVVWEGDPAALPHDAPAVSPRERVTATCLTFGKIRE